VMDGGSARVRFRRLELTDGQAHGQSRQPPADAA
jgi:hypothetical protein